MILQFPHQPQLDPAVEVYVRALLDRAAGLRLLDLFADPHPAALYHLPNRHDVSVIALRTTSLSQDQLSTILTYRLAQYLIAQQVDAYMVYAERMENEPLSSVSPDDIHVIAGSPETGEIYCYATLRAIGATPHGSTLRMRDRSPFPVEKTFGWGIFNHLRILADLPTTQIRELGRFVKNQQLDVRNERSIRAPVEVCVALHHLLRESLNPKIIAIIGDLEEGVAKRNLDFFHVPTVIVREVAPTVTQDAYLAHRFRSRTCYPFAFLVSDLVQQKARLAVIEQALELPGERAIRALLALKRDIRVIKSSLEPNEIFAQPSATKALEMAIG
jgi:hypothetical protein